MSGQVSYTVREVLERIEKKIDSVACRHEERISALERAPRPIASGEHRMGVVETAQTAQDARLQVLEAYMHTGEGMNAQARKTIGWVAVVASVAGVMSSFVFQLLRFFV